MPRLRRQILTLITALALIALPASATARVPRGFVGTNLSGPLFPTTDPSVDLGQELDGMVANGVESLRVAFNWSYAQPYRGWGSVPASQQDQFVNVGGVPTRFSQMDSIVALAATRRLSVLPTVIFAPGWDAAPHPPAFLPSPARTAPYANFVRALVRRYGPGGTFWTQQSPAVPIRMWQIWNETNILYFWPKQPFQRTYIPLLRAAHDAIKSVDPGAKIVLAGLPNESWFQMARTYKVRGARRLFDVVAAHPYTKQPQGVITILGKVRAVMNAAGDGGKPIIADEISWPSSQGKTSHNIGFTFATTEAGQARNLSALLPLLARNRNRLRLMGFYYYTWASIELHGGDPFTFSGLLRLKNGKQIAKPAFFAFRRAALSLENCHQKGPVATECAVP